MNEATYQSRLIRHIIDLIPGCVVLKNDPNEIQGIPDLLILYQDKWAMLEVKLSHRSKIRPNQEYYVDVFGTMSYASFINPENEEEILNELQHAFGLAGETCLSES